MRGRGDEEDLHQPNYFLVPWARLQGLKTHARQSLRCLPTGGGVGTRFSSHSEYPLPISRALLLPGAFLELLLERVHLSHVVARVLGQNRLVFATQRTEAGGRWHAKRMGYIEFGEHDTANLGPVALPNRAGCPAHPPTPVVFQISPICPLTDLPLEHINWWCGGLFTFRPPNTVPGEGAKGLIHVGWSTNSFFPGRWSPAAQTFRARKVQLLLYDEFPKQSDSSPDIHGTFKDSERPLCTNASWIFPAALLHRCTSYFFGDEKPQ